MTAFLQAKQAFYQRTCIADGERVQIDIIKRIPEILIVAKRL
jgi:hypothetical protein